MRELVMDTETTGLDPSDGHRIVEIGAVELINHVPTGRTYHQYINPRRPMPAEAFAVHGLGDEFLARQPEFSAIVDAFMSFVGSDRLVIHNAAFDMRFINAELVHCGRPPLPESQALDTLMLARRKFPGAQASLDALCRRFRIDNSARAKHGALLDSEILAEVYLELIGGRQPDFALASGPSSDRPHAGSDPAWRPGQRARPLRPRISRSESAAHASLVEELGADAIWNKFGSA